MSRMHWSTSVTGNLHSKSAGLTPIILNGACPLDLDMSAFPIGMCTRTVLAKADIVLWRIAEDAFHVEVWRSFTGTSTGHASRRSQAEYSPGGQQRPDSRGGLRTAGEQQH